jgi:hypothetical protein
MMTTSAAMGDVVTTGAAGSTMMTTSAAMGDVVITGAAASTMMTTSAAIGDDTTGAAGSTMTDVNSVPAFSEQQNALFAPEGCSCECLGFDSPLSTCFNHDIPHRALSCSFIAMKPPGMSIVSPLCCVKCAGEEDAMEGELRDEDRKLIGVWAVVTRLQDYIVSSDMETILYGFASALKKVYDHWWNYKPRNKSQKDKKKKIICALKEVCAPITSGRYEIFLDGVKKIAKVLVGELSKLVPEYRFPQKLKDVVEGLQNLMDELGCVEELVGKFGIYGVTESWACENFSFLVTFDDELGDSPQYPHIDLPFRLLQFALSVSGGQLSTVFCTSRFKGDYSDLRIGDGNIDSLIDLYADLLQTFEKVLHSGKYLARRLIPPGCLMASIGGRVHWGPAGRKRVVMFFNVKVMGDRGWISYNRDVQYNALVLRVRVLREKYIDLKALNPIENPLNYKAIQSWLHDTVLNCISWRNTVLQVGSNLQAEAPCIASFMEANKNELDKLHTFPVDEVIKHELYSELFEALQHDIECPSPGLFFKACGSHCARFAS